jgi:NAD(P)-dependent dehydrogenase (short-subunit alcohol dehydrogenase family)
VVVADINHDGASATIEECQKFSKHPQFRAIAVKVDIVDEDSVESMVQSAVKAFGRIDYSVHSAGVRLPGLHHNIFHG